MKKENIGWSPTFRKWVLLDFGFAKILEEDVGKESYSGGFIGTYSHTIKEIKSLYHLKCGGFVDFYYNDLYGLEKTI